MTPRGCLQVTSLQLLCEGTSNSSEATSEGSAAANSSFRKMVENKAQKQAYWAKRTQELEERKQEAEKRKQQIGGGVGLKYTAIAMSQRASVGSTEG